MGNFPEQFLVERGKYLVAGLKWEEVVRGGGRGRFLGGVGGWLLEGGCWEVLEGGCWEVLEGGCWRVVVGGCWRVVVGGWLLGGVGGWLLGGVGGVVGWSGHSDVGITETQMGNSGVTQKLFETSEACGS